METFIAPPPEPATPAPTIALARPAVRRFSAIELLVVLVIWLLSTPVVLQIRGGEMIETVVATAVMLSAVVAVGARRVTLVIALLLVAPVCLCKWTNQVRPDLMPREAHLGGALLFTGFVSVQLVRFVLRAPRVTLEVLCAGVSGYLMLGIVWGFAYAVVDAFDPEAFAFTITHAVGQLRGVEAIYFSFVTLCTVGYGDIVPVSPIARMLAVMEATAGLFYVTVLIARLVALYSATPPSRTAD